jgi:hypothetical protein
VDPEGRGSGPGFDEEYHLDQYATIAFSEMGDMFDFSVEEIKLWPVREIPRAARRAISSIKCRAIHRTKGENEESTLFEVRLWPKNDALETLGRYLKLFDGEHRQRRH